MGDEQDFIIRTEDVRPEEILGLFVPIQRDRELVDKLKSTSPTIVEGSRGTGKSLLLRVCEQEQFSEFESSRVLPIYLSFARSSLLTTKDNLQFQHWMLATLCSRIIRVLAQNGLEARPTEAINLLTGGRTDKPGEKTSLERLAAEFEASYKKPGEDIDASLVPTVERFREAVEDICRSGDIRRFNVLFDEAAHIFRPEQQRQFFTLLRSARWAKSRSIR